MDMLEEALRHITANNGAPGVDGMSLSAFRESAELREKFLHDLQSELKAKCYQPSPVRRVLIPKGNGKMRPLGIPTVKDRVVQTAAVILLQPIFEADMSESSYAYRPRRNARQAMAQITSAILRGHTEILDADLSAYFDTIPHGRLMKLVACRVSDGTMLRLVKAWLRSPIVEGDNNGKTRSVPNKKGTPQGGVISPLLANLYLNDLDHAVPERTQNQAVMVRYADDFVICCRPGKGEQIQARTKRWLESRGLKLNQETSQAGQHPSETREDELPGLYDQLANQSAHKAKVPACRAIGEEPSELSRESERGIKPKHDMAGAKRSGGRT